MTSGRELGSHVPHRAAKKIAVNGKTLLLSTHPNMTTTVTGHDGMNDPEIAKVLKMKIKGKET